MTIVFVKVLHIDVLVYTCALPDTCPCLQGILTIGQEGCISYGLFFQLSLASKSR